MSTVCIIIGIVFFICVLAGWVQGLFRVLVSVAGIVASIFIAAYAAPHLSGYLEEHTDMDDRMAAYISEQLQFSEPAEEASKGIQVAVIKELPLPEGMKENILNNNNSEMYEALNVNGVYDYIAKSIAVVVLNAVVFLSLILICRIFFFFLGKGIKGFSDLPIVRWIDKLGGGFLGAVRGVILIWVFFLILSIASTSAWSQEIVAQISQVGSLKLLYDNNLLLDIVGDLTRVLFL
ncbi:MAG: CvpA family protein [Bacteroidales bacterium]|nr:CvpA family protein [Clostridium sp.]MCM1203701.1 CvpA family protein [Bacteroidales bacterium]